MSRVVVLEQVLKPKPVENERGVRVSTWRR